MKDERDFFRSLRQKLEAQPDRNFDQRFWNAFEKEFGAAPEKRGFFRGFARLFPATAVAGVLVAIVAYQRTGGDAPSSSASSEIVAIGFSEDTEMMQELEFFEGIDDLMLTATEEDWDVLLESEHES